MVGWLGNVKGFLDAIAEKVKFIFFGVLLRGIPKTRNVKIM